MTVPVSPSIPNQYGFETPMAGRCRPFVAGVVLSYSDWVATRQQTVVEPAGRLKIQVALRFAISVDISGVNNVYGLLRQDINSHIVIKQGSDYPNDRSRVGSFGKGSMTMSRQEVQGSKAATKQKAPHSVNDCQRFV